jgi:hypothetical protein
VDHRRDVGDLVGKQGGVEPPKVPPQAVVDAHLRRAPQVQGPLHVVGWGAVQEVESHVGQVQQQAHGVEQNQLRHFVAALVHHPRRAKGAVAVGKEGKKKKKKKTDRPTTTHSKKMVRGG